MSKKHIGSDFDEFLEEQGVNEEVTAQAIKRVIAWQIAKAMKAKKMTKSVLASRWAPAARRWIVCWTSTTLD